MTKSQKLYSWAGAKAEVHSLNMAKNKMNGLTKHWKSNLKIHQLFGKHLRNITLSLECIIVILKKLSFT